MENATATEPLLRGATTGRVVVDAALAGVLGGILTAYAQGWLPDSVSSMANSSTTWSAVALVVAWRAGSRVPAVLAAVVALWTLEAGYVIGSAMKGNTSSPSTIAFWIFMGTLAGPLIGLSADAIARSRAETASLALGAVVGVAIGEGVYGLTVVESSTSPWFWTGEIVVGVAALLVVGLIRLRSWQLLATSAVVAAAVGAAFVATYQADLLGALT